MHNLFNFGRVFKVQRRSFKLKEKILSTATSAAFMELSFLECQLTSCNVKYCLECDDGMMRGESEVSGKRINMQHVRMNVVVHQYHVARQAESHLRRS